MDVVAQGARDRALAILLVDGRIETRATLAEALRAARCQVVEAATTDEALALLNSRLEIDSVVIQARVGGSMDGLALDDWVRKTRPLLRVVVVSGSLDADAVRAALHVLPPGP